MQEINLIGIIIWNFQIELIELVEFLDKMIGIL